MQLKPSRKREMRGCAVEVNRACWVLSCPCTWSNVKCCFFALATGDGDEGAVVVPAPEAAGAEVVTSMDTEVDAVA